MTEIEADHSHLYPSATGRVVSGGDGKALLRFADGASAQATLEWPLLRVEAYTTAAGTRIEGKSWKLNKTADGYQVASRFPT